MLKNKRVLVSLPWYNNPSNCDRFVEKINYVQFKLHSSNIPILDQNFQKIPTSKSDQLDISLPHVDEFIHKYEKLLNDTKSMLSKIPDFSFNADESFLDIIKISPTVNDAKLLSNIDLIKKINDVMFVLSSNK